MPEVTGIGGGGVTPQNQDRVGERSGPAAVNRAGAPPADAPVGQPGPLGQPTGLPAPAAPGQSVMPDVVAGRDASQLAAAEQMRARGGASATDELLGLNRQPTIAGALAAPPGNSEALRHMTPTMRRTIMRNLLDKQRERVRRLAYLVRREGGREDSARQDDENPSAPDEEQLERARLELGHAARMLDLLEELLAMQDYTISQMGTFSQG